MGSRSWRRWPTGACSSPLPSPGPYAALPLARELDSRLVGGIAEGIRTALDDPRDGYAARAQELLAPWRREAVDAVVREQLLPRLVSRA